MKPSISFIIPAYNEEDHLMMTYEKTVEVLAAETSDYEIIIIDDGSVDKTASIADEIARANPNVTVIHNPKNMGFGFTCRAGIEKASKDYCGWISADTYWNPQALKTIIGMLGETDIITAYTLNSHERVFIRRVISTAFTHLWNTLFGFRMKYYNGACIHRTALLQSIPLVSDGLTLWAEALVRLMSQGYRCREIGAEFPHRKLGKTKAFKFKNIIATVKIIFVLLWDINYRKHLCTKVFPRNSP